MIVSTIIIAAYSVPSVTRVLVLPAWRNTFNAIHIKTVYLNQELASGVFAYVRNSSVQPVSYICEHFAPQWVSELIILLSLLQNFENQIRVSSGIY